jgi:tetratricopeptide (TPR) repeat protein
MQRIEKWITILVIVFVTIPNLSKAQSIAQVRMYLAKSNNQAALNMLDKLEAHPPLSSDLFFLKGIAQLNLYRPMDAIESFSKAVTMDSSRVDCLEKLAECYSMTGDEIKASVFYKKALAKDTDNTPLQMKAANYFLTTDEIPVAKELYEKIYRSDSTNIIVNRSLATCYDHLKMETKAILFYRKTIIDNPHDFPSVNRLCNLLIGQKRYNEALAITENFRKNDTTNQRINSTNAYIYYLQNKDSAAVNRFADYYTSGDSSLFTLKYYGISCFKNKQYDKTVQILEKAYRQDTTDALITNYLGLSCYLSFYKAKGILYLQKTIDLATPDSVYLSSLYFNLGQAYDAYDKSKCSDAYKAYRQAFQLNSKDGNILLLLAVRADNCMNDKQEALRYYKMILNMWGTEKNDKQTGNDVAAAIIVSIRKRVKELEA